MRGSVAVLREEGRSSVARGFTIVELLVVIVVIAILAAITAVAYTGFQNKAYESTVKSDLANFKKKLEMIVAESGEAYPASPVSSTNTWILGFYPSGSGWAEWTN